MPSPFPGMDPYLENPVWWPDFHHSFITYARDALQPGLRPRYRARVCFGSLATASERVYQVSPPQHYYPDIAILKRPIEARSLPREESDALSSRLGEEKKKETPLQNVNGGNSQFAMEGVSQASHAMAEADNPVIITLPKEAQKQGFIEILHADGAVVSVIEVLSPVNKTPWRERLHGRRRRDNASHARVYPRGLNDYHEKQRQLLWKRASFYRPLESATHLVEIDLLRSGTHAVAVPSELVAEQCAKWDYLVCEFTPPTPPPEGGYIDEASYGASRVGLSR